MKNITSENKRGRPKLYKTETEQKEKKKEWDRKTYLNKRKKYVVSKKCINCGDLFHAFLKAKHCSISCGTKMQHKKTKMEKENRKIDYKELWSVFWPSYYRKSIKDRQNYLDVFLEEYIK